MPKRRVGHDSRTYFSFIDLPLSSRAEKRRSLPACHTTLSSCDGAFGRCRLLPILVFRSPHQPEQKRPNGQRGDNRQPVRPPGFRLRLTAVTSASLSCEIEIVIVFVFTEEASTISAPPQMAGNEFMGVTASTSGAFWCHGKNVSFRFVSYRLASRRLLVVCSFLEHFECRCVFSQKNAAPPAER